MVSECNWGQPDAQLLTERSVGSCICTSECIQYLWKALYVINSAQKNFSLYKMVKSYPFILNINKI